MTTLPAPLEEETCSRVLDKHREKIKALIEQTVETGKELGFVMCGETLEAGEECEGTEACVVMTDCGDKKQVGKLHTHPTIKKVNVFSNSDFFSGLRSGSRFTCIAYKTPEGDEEIKCADFPRLDLLQREEFSELFNTFKKRYYEELAHRNRIKEYEEKGQEYTAKKFELDVKKNVDPDASYVKEETEIMGMLNYLTDERRMLISVGDKLREDQAESHSRLKICKKPV